MTDDGTQPRRRDALWAWAKSLGHEVWVMAAAFAMAVGTVLVGTRQPSNTLAASLLQAGTLVLTVYASLIIGRGHGEETAKRVLRTHAMSAWRRMRNLYEALGRQHEAINAQADRLDNLVQDEKIDFEHVRGSLSALEMMVSEQIGTADDALEDWRSLIPEEIERIERQAQRRSSDG